MGLPASRRKRRGVFMPGRAVVLTPGGGAESFLAAGAVLPRGQDGLGMEKGFTGLGFSADTGYGEALEQPGLADEGALRRASIPLCCSATSQTGTIPTLDRDQSGDAVTIWPRERVYERFVHQKLQNAPHG